MQEGLLFHANYDAQAPDVYTIQLALSLTGALDHEALARAARALLRRHAGLRAGFRYAGLGRPVQVVVPDAVPRWSHIDLSMLDEAARARRLDDILAQDRAERFDLASPPLVRFALIRLAPDEHRLVLTGHHILMDGWSLPVLVRELLALYAHELNTPNWPIIATTATRPHCRASPPMATISPGSPGRTMRLLSQPGGRRWPGSMNRPTWYRPSRRASARACRPCPSRSRSR